MTVKGRARDATRAARARAPNPAPPAIPARPRTPRTRPHRPSPTRALTRPPSRPLPPARRPDPSPDELAQYRGESMSAAHRLGSTPFMIQHEDSVKGKRRTPKLKSGSVPSNRANEMWERNMAESSGSDGSRPTSRGGSARAGEAFVEEGEDARLGRLTIASSPKNKCGGEKPPNTPPNKSPTNRSPMRSPTASRGGSVRAGGQQPNGGVRGILRRRESEDQVAEPTPAPAAEDAAENGSVASSAPGAARSIDFDGLPAEDQEKSASPPRRHARFVDARLDDDAFEHPAVMQRRVDDGYSSSASSVEAEFETFHANGSPKNGSPAGKANRAGGAPRSKSRSPPSPSARASPKSMFGKVVGVFREGRRRSVDDDDASWRVGSVRENSLMDRESHDRILEKLRAHAERGDPKRRA